LKSISIIGVGLIGGSIGLAVKKQNLAAEVVGIGRRQSSLDRALAAGTVSRATLDLADGVRDAELVIVCSPVGLIADHVRQSAEHCPEGTLITDAGSTKSGLAEQLEGKLPRGCRFVGSHPLAGSEKSGPDHAFAELYEGRLAILTPTERSLPDDIALLETFWARLGANVVRLSPDEHDRIMAMTSHLPHAVSVALAATLTEGNAEWTGSGFRDTSRLAAGSPTVWTDIFSQNREHMLCAIREFQAQLGDLYDAIELNDSARLNQLLAEVKAKRDSLD
jgi:cyclohexadieny/prephenate dehydrogenase